MAKQVFLDCRAYVSGCDLSGYSNKIEVGQTIEEKVTTNFRSGGARELLGGLAEVELDGEGQFEEGDASKPGDSFWANRRVIEPWSIAPDGQSDLSAGTLMYLANALRTDMKLLGAVGEVSPWTGSGKGNQALVRGRCLHPSGVARTATGTGTIVDYLAGPTAGQYVLANLHVLSVAGTSSPTLTVAIQSATTVGFGSPTTRGTFTAATAVGGQTMKIAAPGTDRWWRVSYTITGTTPSFLFMTSLGIE